MHGPKIYLDVCIFDLLVLKHRPISACRYTADEIFKNNIVVAVFSMRSSEILVFQKRW